MTIVGYDAAAFLRVLAFGEACICIMLSTFLPQASGINVNIERNAPCRHRIVLFPDHLVPDHRPSMQYLCEQPLGNLLPPNRSM